MKFSLFFLTVYYSFTVFAQNSDEYYWFDGKEKRSIKLIENILVEVPNPKNFENSVASNNSNSKLNSKQKMTEKLKTIPAAFKVENVESTGRMNKIHVRSNNFREDIKQNLGGNFSPLFLDGPGAKALAGGVIVTFVIEKSEAEVEAWAQSQNIKIKNKMGLINGRTWLVESVAGLASLDLANQLFQAPDVEFSQPNWAHDHSSRVLTQKQILPRHQQNKDKSVKPKLLYKKNH
jgi:hypothetical protein